MKNMTIISKYKRLSKKTRFCIWFATAFLFYTVIGFFVLPPVTGYFLKKKLPAVFHRDVALEKVRFNPFTLDLKLNGLGIGKKGTDRQLVYIHGLEVNLQAVSLFKRALVLSVVKVNSPEIYLSMDKKGRFNFQDILEGGGSEDKQADERPFYFSLNNIEIRDGFVEFRDEVKGVTHVAKDINIGIPFISNLKARVKIFTKPYFAAVVNGAHLEFKGETRPFAGDHSTRLHIRLSNLDLVHYLAYASDFIDCNVDSGSLSTDLQLIFSMKADGSQDVELGGNATLSSLSMSMKGASFFKMKALRLIIAPSNLIKKQVWFSGIYLDRPLIEIIREKDGSINLARLLRKQKDAGPGGKGTAGKDKDAVKLAVPLDLRISKAALVGGRLSFRDLAAGSGIFETSLKSVNASLQDFGTLNTVPSRLKLSFRTLRGENADIAGTLAVQPVSLQLSGNFTSLKLADYAPYYQEFINARVAGGMADVSTSFALKMEEDGQPDVVVSNLGLKVSGFDLSGAGGPEGKGRLVHVPLLELSGGVFDLGQKLLHMDTVRVSGLDANALIDKSGQVNLAGIVKKSQARDNESGSGGDEGQFHVILDNFELKKGRCDFQDLSGGGRPVHLALSNMGISLKNLDTDPGKKAGFNVAMAVGKKGLLKVNGSTDIKLKDFQASVKVDRLGLRQFQGYVSRFSNAVLYKGRLYMKTEVRMNALDSGSLKVAVRGDATLGDGIILDPVARKPVVKWKAIRAQGVLFENEPLKLHIKQVLLDRLSGDIFYDRKGNLNLLALFKQEHEAGKAASAASGRKAGNSISAAGTGSAKKASEKKVAQDIRINRVVFRECAVNMKDMSVSPPFSRLVRHINGTIKGLSSRADMKAQVDIRGLADNSADMELKGFINPLSRPVFVDVRLKADGVGMTSFSPYTAKFLGYMIQKGKLTSQVHLVIRDGKLTAEDKVFLDQFEFGHSVESKDAVSLPVKLAVSLLKDRHGQINLDIPVHGRLDDPEFSLSGVIMHAIINIFVKAATSPFSLIAAIAGSSEDLRQVEFDPGSCILNEAARKKLETLAKALTDRPALKVELTGYYDPDVDRKGLEDLKFMRLLKKEKMDDLDDEQREKISSVDDVDIGHDEFNKYLAKAYKHAPFDKPKMFIGLLKKQPPEVMEKMLREHIKITRQDLENLAFKRAQAVQDYMVSNGGIDVNRIFLVKPENAAMEKGNKGTVVKLSLK